MNKLNVTLHGISFNAEVDLVRAGLVLRVLDTQKGQETNLSCVSHNVKQQSEHVLVVTPVVWQTPQGDYELLNCDMVNRSLGEGTVHPASTIKVIIVSKRSDADCLRIALPAIEAALFAGNYSQQKSFTKLLFMSIDMLGDISLEFAENLRSRLFKHASACTDLTAAIAVFGIPKYRWKALDRTRKKLGLKDPLSELPEDIRKKHFTGKDGERVLAAYAAVTDLLPSELRLALASLTSERGVQSLAHILLTTLWENPELSPQALVDHLSKAISSTGSTEGLIDDLADYFSVHIGLDIHDRAACAKGIWLAHFLKPHQTHFTEDPSTKADSPTEPPTPAASPSATAAETETETATPAEALEPTPDAGAEAETETASETHEKKTKKRKKKSKPKSAPSETLPDLFEMDDMFPEGEEGMVSSADAVAEELAE